MTESAAIGEACADGDVGMDIAEAVALCWALTLHMSKLTLEQLATAADGTERITIDDEDGRAWGHEVSTPRPDLIAQRLMNTSVGIIRRLRVVDHLG